MTEADRIKNKMDLNAKPCENFYQYACGKFQPKFIDDRTEMDEFIMVEDALREKLMEIMDERIKVIDGTAARLVKGFYQSCMNMGMCLNRWLFLVNELRRTGRHHNDEQKMCFIINLYFFSTFY
jgi:predicted metalloendopeptidase